MINRLIAIPNQRMDKGLKPIHGWEGIDYLILA